MLFNTWADDQAKMLILSSLKCKEPELTFHVLNISFCSPLWEGYGHLCFIQKPMEWTPLNPSMAQ